MSNSLFVLQIQTDDPEIQAALRDLIDLVASRDATVAISEPLKEQWLTRDIAYLFALQRGLTRKKVSRYLHILGTIVDAVATGGEEDWQRQLADNLPTDIGQVRYSGSYIARYTLHAVDFIGLMMRSDLRQAMLEHDNDYSLHVDAMCADLAKWLETDYVEQLESGSPDGP
jgi:hypothetical protein